MYSFKVDIDFNNLTVCLNKVKQNSLKGFQKAVKETAEGISKDAQNNIKKNSYKTGALSRSINTIYGKQGMEATIQATAAHGIFIEEGTKAHIIKPKNKKALAFSSGNKMVFAKKVKHPGTKAKPFMAPAFNKNAPEFLERLERVLDGSN